MAEKNFWEREPWQTITDIIKIRNSLAHPKVEIIKRKEILELSQHEFENYGGPEPKWLERLDMEKIQNIMEKTKNTMEELCKTNKINTDAIRDLGFSTMTSKNINT